MSRSAPSWANFIERLAEVSPGEMGSCCWHRMGPVSMPGSMRMIVIPVVSSPFKIAAWIGAAPRQRGRSEACTLMQPYWGFSSTAGRRICPNAATTMICAAHCSSCWAASSSLKRCGWITGSFSSSARILIGGEVSSRPRPAGRSG